MCTISPKTKKKTCADSIFVGGPNLSPNITALGESSALRVDLAVVGTVHLKLLEQCFVVSYQFLVAKGTGMEQLLCHSLPQGTRYRESSTDTNLLNLAFVSYKPENMTSGKK